MCCQSKWKTTVQTESSVMRPITRALRLSDPIEIPNWTSKFLSFINVGIYFIYPIWGIGHTTIHRDLKWPRICQFPWWPQPCREKCWSRFLRPYLEKRSWRRTAERFLPLGMSLLLGRYCFFVKQTSIVLTHSYNQLDIPCIPEFSRK